MGLNFHTTKQKILSIIIIGLFLTIFHILVFYFFHPVKIVDDNVPLAATFEAMFYVEDSDSGDITCVGDGLIKATRNINGDAEAVAAAIVSSPDYSSYISDDLVIKWNSIRLQDNTYSVYGNIGRAADPLPEKLSIRRFGAVGDGVTDDSLAFNNAMRQVKSTQTLYIPSGTYVLGSTVYVPQGVTLRGDPNGGTVLIAQKGTPRGRTIVYVTNAQNVSIENICISGNSSVNYENMDATEGIHLLDLWNSNNVTIKNCKFIDNVNCAIRDIGTSNVTVDHCTFTNVDCGFITLGSTDVNNLTITNNTFDGHQASEPVSLFASARHNHALIQDNTIKNKTFGYAILVEGRKPNTDIKIIHNIIDKCSVGISVSNTTDLLVQNNTITNTTGGAGLRFITCKDALVDNNYCANAKQDGLFVKDCTNLTLNKITTLNCGWVNVNYFNVRFTGDSNKNISYTNSTVSYDKSKIGLCFTCNTDIKMDNIEYTNSTLWLTQNTSNITLSIPKAVSVKDQGVLNKIKKY